MTRVVLFSFDYAPLDGGIARLCTELRGGLVAQGVEVSVLTAQHGCSQDEPGVTRLDGRRAVLEAQALQILRTLPRDTLLLCGRWYPEGLLALLAGHRNVVLLAHGAELLASRVAALSSTRAWVRRRVLQAARLVIANSHYTADLVRRVADRARVAALPLGVDPTTFSPGDVDAARAELGITSRLVVSTVARVQPFKGHDTIIHALGRLPAEVRRELTYFVAGRGPHTDALRALTRSLGVEQQVVFGGLVPEASLPQVYRASSLFCLMTRSEARAVEGFGLALLEAQSCGVPVLGTNLGGIPDALADGETGFLLAPHDVEGVEHHLLRLARDPDYYRMIGQAGRERAVRECSWHAYAGKLREALQLGTAGSAGGHAGSW